MIPSSRDVVRKLYAQVGYKCKGKNASYSKWIDKNYPGFYNGKKYGVADWCDITFDFCVLAIARNKSDAAKTLCQPLKSAGAGVKWSYDYYKAKKRVTSIPHYGDQIFFSSNGKRSGLYHTAGVYNVTPSHVYYVAGNETKIINGKKYQVVQKHKISRKNKKIFAYGRPIYSDWKTIK